VCVQRTVGDTNLYSRFVWDFKRRKKVKIIANPNLCITNILDKVISNGVYVCLYKIMIHLSIEGQVDT
jgi:hypothetical protein